jgi:hypothetical protein
MYSADILFLKKESQKFGRIFINVVGVHILFVNGKKYFLKKHVQA